MHKKPDQYFMDDAGNLLRMRGNQLENLPEPTESPSADIQRSLEAFVNGIQRLRNAQGALAEFSRHLAAMVENLPEFGELLISDGGGEPLPEFDPTLERIHDPASEAADTDFSDNLSRQIASGEIVVAREDVDIDEVLAKIDAHTHSK